MQLIGNPMIFRQLPLEQALRRTRDLGYDAFELWGPQLVECRTDALRNRLRILCEDKLGMPLIRLNVADAPYFTPRRRKGDWRGVLPGLCQDIDVTAALGMPHLLTWEGRIPTGASRKDRFGWILSDTTELFLRAVEYGARKDVQLSLEVHPYTLGIDTEWMVALLDRVGSRTFGVTYDCCHYGVGQPDTYVDAIRQLGRRIRHVHFSDSDRVSSEVHFAPGTGCLDLAAIVKAFKAIPFTGTVMQDLWLYPLPEEGARTGIPRIRKAFAWLKRGTRP